MSAIPKNLAELIEDRGHVVVILAKAWALLDQVDDRIDALLPLCTARQAELVHEALKPSDDVLHALTGDAESESLIVAEEPR